jgi:acyl carrier protein
MENKSIEEQLKEFISSNLLFTDKVFPYKETDSFLTLGIIDSLGIMELVGFVEDHFKITVENWDITPTNFDSVEQLARYIRGKAKIPA